MWDQDDVDSHLASRTSFKARDLARKNQSFETTKEARGRLAKKQPTERQHGQKEIKGKLEQLLADVNEWPVDKDNPINWSQKAIQYEIRKAGSQDSPPNAGQILKQYLQSKGVDTSKFDGKGSVGKFKNSSFHN